MNCVYRIAPGELCVSDYFAPPFWPFTQARPGSSACVACAAPGRLTSLRKYFLCSFQQSSPEIAALAGQFVLGIWSKLSQWVGVVAELAEGPCRGVYLGDLSRGQGGRLRRLNLGTTPVRMAVISVFGHTLALLAIGSEGRALPEAHGPVSPLRG